MKTLLKALIESGKKGSMTLNGLRVNQYKNGVINVIEPDGTLTRARLDEFRAALTAAGYREKESWVASQGVSWLSDGVFAGVSMRLEKI